jgi:hypothetical protein
MCFSLEKVIEINLNSFLERPLAFENKSKRENGFVKILLFKNN